MLESAAGGRLPVPSACSAWTRNQQPHCASCGYDLRGCSGPRCPECGTGYAPTCPDCSGRGQHVFLTRGRRMIVSLAITLLFAVPVVLFVQSWNWTTAIGLLATAGVLLFFAALAGASQHRCMRCHGTGIDFEDRIWTGPSA